jgi:hypothetical protein
MIDELTVVIHTLNNHKNMLEKEIRACKSAPSLSLYEFQFLQDCEQALTSINGTLRYFDENGSRIRVS